MRQKWSTSRALAIVLLLATVGVLSGSRLTLSLFAANSAGNETPAAHGMLQQNCSSCGSPRLSR
jgi:hypothetical protein